MYIRIPDHIGAETGRDYRAIKALTFAPEVDLTLASIPINQFTADIITDDAISIGSGAMLYDNRGALWANFRVTKFERLDRQTVRVTAQSELAYMERWTVPARMYLITPLRDFVDGLFDYPPASGTLYYNLQVDIDAYFTSEGTVVTGYCPEQTARERLQWLCLTIGALVKQWQVDHLTIVPSPDGVNPNTPAGVLIHAATLIPASDTFWKPAITTRDNVAALTVTSYQNFTDTDPGSDTGLKWETAEDADGRKWWFTPNPWTFENSEVEIGQTVSINGVTIIDGSALWDVLNRLSVAYFRQGNIDVDVINNGQYWPGQKVHVYTDAGTVYTGFIQSCDFQFGLQARSKLVVSTDLSPVPMGMVRVTYEYDDLTLAHYDYHWPEGYDYTINNPCLSLVIDGHWQLYCPTHATLSGTVGVTIDDITEPVYLALDLDLKSGALRVISVDSVVQRGNSGVIG